MAHASTTFDRHYEGKVLLDEVPTGVETKAFDFHFEGMMVVAEAAATDDDPHKGIFTGLLGYTA